MISSHDIRAWYIEEDLTQAEVGARLGVSQVHAGRLLRRAGVVAKLKSDRIRLPDVTRVQHEVIIGSLLGDGSMSQTGEATARFSEGHSQAQEGYLRWKAEILAPYATSIFATKKTVEGRVYDGFGFTTHGCRQFRPYYDLFYASGVRVFPANLSELLTPLALSIWYMDDGSIANRFHPRIAFGLDDVSLERAVSALHRLGLQSTVHGIGGDRSIMFPGQSDAFFNIVGSHVGAIPCMESKLPAPSIRRERDRNAQKLDSSDVAQFLQAGLTVGEIAEMFGVSRSTVTRRRDSDSRGSMGRPTVLDAIRFFG